MTEIKNSTVDFLKMIVNESIKNKKYIFIYTILLFILTSSLININLSSLKLKLFVFCILLILGYVCINLYTLIKPEKRYVVIFIIILCFGLISCILNPISIGHDEHEHFVRSEITSQGDFFPVPVSNEGFMTIKSVDHLAKLSSTPSNIFNATGAFEPIDYTKAIHENAFSQNLFIGYLSQALGILLAEFLSLDAIYLLWFSRIFNLILYAFLVSIAFKHINNNLKIPLFIIACSPLAMFQATTSSIDVTINGLSFILITYFLYMLESKELSKKHMIVFMVLTLILGGCKITCFSFIFLLFFIPKNNFKNKNNYYFGLLMIVIVSILSLLWTFYYALPNEEFGRRAVYSILNVNHTQQLNYLHTHPKELLTSLLSIIKYFNFDLFSFNTGWGNISSTLISSLYIIFFGSLILFYPINHKFSNKIKFGMLLICIMIFLGSCIAELFTYTSVGLINNITGIQQRYFLPFFLLLPLIFNLNLHIKEKSKINQFYTIGVLLFLSLEIMSILFFYY